MFKNLWIIAVVLVFVSCSDSSTQKGDKTLIENPHANGFDIENSDPKAIEIADNVMKAMGGRIAWDNTQCIEWSFFGYRNLTWDKTGEKIRIEYLQRQDLDMLYDIKADTIMEVQLDGKTITDSDQLLMYKSKARNIYFNDVYWLFMPFKLKDSGVTLKYKGTAEIDSLVHEPTHVLELTFKDVGATPENKYIVHVSKKDNLVKGWRYYAKTDDKEPTYQNAWLNYQRYGKILLSPMRGLTPEDKLGDINVYANSDKELFDLSK